MVDRNVLEQLSGSSRDALRWAAAAAACRADPGEPPPPADGTDLLVGLLIAHGDGSEPWALCRHFGVPVGRVLRDRPRPAAGALAKAYEMVAAVPHITPEVENALRTGLSQASFPKGTTFPGEATFPDGGLLTFPGLFGALLTARTPALSALWRRWPSEGYPSTP